MVEKVKVFHFAGSELRRHRFPRGAEFEEEGLTAPGYPGFEMKACEVASLPYLYSDGQRLTAEGRSLLELKSRGLGDAYARLRSSLLADQEAPSHDAFLVNGHVFTQHESPEEQSAEAKGGEHDEWMVLLSFCSDPRIGFQFGDSGTLTFCIHKRDLAAEDFSRVVATMESS